MINRCEIMKKAIFLLGLSFCLPLFAQVDKSKVGKSPLDELPKHIKQLTHFGQRADWFHDGSKFLFVEKTYGDVYEYEMETGEIFCITNHYYHGGYTRALYLSNGDVLLSGCTSFDAEKAKLNRYEKAELWVLDKSYTKPPVPLHTPCYEGPAVSRTRLRIAFVVSPKQTYTQEEGHFQMYVADIEYKQGIPQLVNKKEVFDNKEQDFYCRPETQNFRPGNEDELIMAAYDYRGCEVLGLDLNTGNITNYSNTDKIYQEPEGIFPDGNYTLIESDEQYPLGWKYVDIWKLKLDGSRERDRLTFFTNYPSYKSSNPVISDNGRYMLFQLASSVDQAGVGYGIFIYDFKQVKK